MDDGPADRTDVPRAEARELLALAPRLLTPEGRLLIELGADQAPRIEELAERAGMHARLHEDLAGIPRLSSLQWRYCSTRKTSRSKCSQKQFEIATGHMSYLRLPT